VKGVRISKENSDSEINNTKKINPMATQNTRYRNNKMFGVLVKVLELFLSCPILVLVYKWEL
jgi:hypothetical protein